MKITSRTALAAISLALTSGFAVAAKIAPDVAGTLVAGKIPVIVRFSAPASDLQIKWVAQLGGVLNGVLSAINGAAVSIPASALKALAADPSVIHISVDHAVKGMLEYANPAVHADTALQYGFDGTGVGVAVIDSGVNDHPDLRVPGVLGMPGVLSRVVYRQSFLPGGSSADNFGHGSHVAGIIAGNGYSSGGPNAIHTFRGIAPNATIISLKVLDDNGNGTESAVIAAIHQAVRLKPCAHRRWPPAPEPSGPHV